MNGYLYIEPFAGSAAVMYGLLRKGAKPPISYVGRKSGYVPAILDALGLSSYDPPSGIILSEPGPWAAIHACFGGASGLSAEDVASFVTYSAWTTGVRGDMYMGPDRISKGHVAGSTRAITLSGICDSVSASSSVVSKIIHSWKNEEPRKLWDRLKERKWESLMPVEGGRWLGPQDPEDVAAWVLTGAWCYKQGQHESGGPVLPGDRRQDTTAVGVSVSVAQEIKWPPLSVWQGTAETLVLPDDLSNAIIFMDPPYKGDGTRKITGYPHGDCPRENVLRLAREWSDRGARIAISECVSLREELGSDWCDVEISHTRKGAMRSFTKNQGDDRKEPQEWLTMNRPPVIKPMGRQQGLFVND